MKWFLLKLVYQIICGDGEHKAQFDEQLRLIEAEDRFHAFTKGRCLGENEQDSFYNSNEKLVQWKFIDVSEIYEIGNKSDGAEIYSNIHETDDAANYTKRLNAKANQLFQESMQHYICGQEPIGFMVS